MATVPRERFGSEKTVTGSLISPGVSVWDRYYEGLLNSEGHKRFPSGRWSGGGPLYVNKYEVFNGQEHSLTYRYFGPATTLTLRGVAGATGQSAVLPVPATWKSVSDSASNYYLAGHNRAKPGAPVAGLGQFLVELRDLPTVPGRSLFKGNVLKGASLSQLPRRLFAALKNYRALGSEYLNVVFGWKPFVNDVRKMYNLWHTIDKRMASIVRNNGKGVRRRVDLGVENNTVQTSTAYNFAYANVYSNVPNIFGGKTLHSVSTTTYAHRWYVAKYRYYIPDTSSSLWNAKARLALFGALPTPELLWSVLPWSWLFGWFSDVDGFFANLSPGAVDNLTSDYSFTMEQKVTKIEAQASVSHPKSDPAIAAFVSYPSFDGSFTTTERLETKVRVGGSNPFGFNTQLPSLSSYQLGILAALGLSRSSVR